MISAHTSISQDLLDYPVTRTVNQTDIYHGLEVKDDYRWLENTQTEEVNQWIEGQNKVSKKFLRGCVSKQNTYNLTEKYTSMKFDYPQKIGSNFYKFMYYSQHATPALYIQSGINREPRQLVDPNYISVKDRINLNGLAVSANDKYLAYQFSRNGSDWREIKVMSLKGKGHLKDHITGAKYSGFDWFGDGFYYITYPNNGKFATAQQPKIFYHKLRTNQEEDSLIFQTRHPINLLSIDVTKNERYITIKDVNGTKGYTNVFYQDIKGEVTGLKPLFLKFKSRISILDSYEDDLIIETSHDSNTDYLVRINPSKPYEWKILTPKYEDAELLYSVLKNDKIFALYQFYNRSIISVFDYEGNNLKNIELPKAMSVGGFQGGETEDELLFHLQSYIIPTVVYTFNTISYEYKIKRKTEVAYDLKKFRFDEKEAISKDGTKIPFILIYKAGIEKNGLNPTLLKAYGGFGVIPNESFDGGLVAFLQKGGVFAFANVRGGGEFGEKWWTEGRGLNKVNSMDDFIAVSEQLIKEGYTSSKKLAITGGSNGGLVAGASMIMRPDLYGAAVLNVGVYDMMRLENYTVGQVNIVEFGTVTDSTDFDNMYSYSPLHNIQEEINYPACLIITAENDDRVPPFQSYKFASKLQNREVQTNPILLKVNRNAGHYGGGTKSEWLQEDADMYGFILEMLKD